MASKRALRRKTCESKTRYASLALAQAKARRASGRVRGAISAYGPCRWCKGFHIGHTPARVRQSMRARQEAKGDE